jgi:integrase/transposase InsO family protein
MKTQNNNNLKKSTALFDPSAGNLFPNQINRQFVVKFPYTVLASDLHVMKNAFINNTKTKLILFICMDLATGKILAMRVMQKTSSNEIALIMKPILKEAWQLYKGSKKTILHSDRGAEYRAKPYQNLILGNESWLEFSMNRYAKPIDNAVVERLFKTTNQLDYIWVEALGHSRIDQYTSLEQANEIWEKWRLVYNQKHKNQRNQHLGADAYEKALVQYIQKQKTDTPGFDMAYKNPVDPVSFIAKEEIQTFQVLAVNDFMYPNQNNSLNQEALQKLTQIQLTVEAVSQNQAAQAQTLPKFIKEQMDSTVTSAKNEILDAINKPKTKKQGIPRPLRTPLTFMMQEMITLNAISSNRDLHKVRDTLAIIIQSALGTRNNEIREITFDQLNQLIVTKRFSTYMSKQGKTDIKVISDLHAELLNQILPTYKSGLNSIKRIFTDDDYVFTALTEPYQLITQNHFTSRINELLKDFGTYYEEQYGIKPTLRSHSARVNFVTELFENEVPLDLIRQQVGHKDIRSTLIYNRFVYNEEQKKNTLNNLRRKKINNNPL